MTGHRWRGMAATVLLAIVAPTWYAFVRTPARHVVTRRSLAASPIPVDSYPGPDPLLITPTIPDVWFYPLELPAAEVARMATSNLVRHGALPPDATIVAATDIASHNQGGITPWLRPDGVVGHLVAIVYSGRISLSLPGSDGLPHAFARITVDRVSGSPFAFESGDDLGDFGEE